MDINLLTAIIGLASGAFGYWFTTFSMQPILRYREIRNKVFSDFIYFAQVTDAEGLNEDMQDLYRQRVLSNRTSSANLRAVYLDLPCWYTNHLKSRGLDPEGAAKSLIGFSNTKDHTASFKLEQKIRGKLGLPTET